MDKLLHQNPSCSFSPRWEMVLPKKTSIEGNSNTIKLQGKHPLLKREKSLKHLTEAIHEQQIKLNF
jgi:hypothetical protein